jgi:hypothetical protein
MPSIPRPRTRYQITRLLDRPGIFAVEQVATMATTDNAELADNILRALEAQEEKTNGDQEASPE